MKILKIDNFNLIKKAVPFGAKKPDMDKTNGVEKVKPNPVNEYLETLAAQMKVIAERNSISIQDFKNMGGEFKNGKPILCDEPLAGLISVNRENGDLYLLEYDYDGRLKASTKIPAYDLEEKGFVKKYIDEDTTKTYYLDGSFKHERSVDENGVTNIISVENEGQRHISYKKGEFASVEYYGGDGFLINSRKTEWDQYGRVSSVTISDNDSERIVYFEKNGDISRIQEIKDTEQGVICIISDPNGKKIREERYQGAEVVVIEYSWDGKIKSMRTVPNPMMPPPKPRPIWYYDATYPRTGILH